MKNGKGIQKGKGNESKEGKSSGREKSDKKKQYRINEVRLVKNNSMFSIAAKG